MQGVPFVSPSLTSTLIINSPGKPSARFKNFDSPFVLEGVFLILLSL
jgi:hypothetical protein